MPRLYAFLLVLAPCHLGDARVDVPFFSLFVWMAPPF
jgi:hypothetical protein